MYVTLFNLSHCILQAPRDFFGRAITKQEQQVQEQRKKGENSNRNILLVFNLCIFNIGFNQGITL